MNNQTRFPRTALALSLAAVLGVLQPSFAGQTTAQATKPATEQAAAKPDMTKLSAEQKVAYLAHIGRIALSHVENARQNLESKHADAAKQQLVEAQTLLTEVKNNTQEKMVPVFARIGFTEQFDVTDTVKQKLEGINDHVVKGNHEKVVEIMKETGAAMAYTHVEIPLDETIAKVDAALKAIDEKAIDKADQELTAAMDGIHVETFTVSAGQG